MTTPGRVALLPLALALTLGSCGKKGPPLAPLRRVPVRVEDLSAERRGDRVVLRLTLPAGNQDGSAPADLDRVDVYAFTDDPRLAAAGPIANRELLRLATIVASIEVRPPPPPASEDQPDKPGDEPPEPVAKVEDPRPAQGAVTLAHEDLTALAATPVVRPAEPRRDADEEAEPPAPIVGSVAPLEATAELVRFYVAVPVSRHERRGPFSARVAVPLGPVPDAPAELAATYTADAVTLTWTSPGTGPRLVQEPAGPDVLQSRPILGQLEPYTFHVYELAGGGSAAPDRKLTDVAIEGPPFDDRRVEFGLERCYAVRTVYTLAEGSIESAPSPRACVKMADVFPPAAPHNLAAVVSEGAISLIWEGSDEPDLAGYLVLRGAAPGATLDPLMSEPIRSSTYRDTTVTPGVRYVYAIVAVDKASPANRSEPSNRVEDTAR